MSDFFRTLKLLKGYFQMYWLKPFDAINDAANAISLLQFDWSRKPILEIGGGDGVFSFIMHGGKFNFMDDRYDQADNSRKDDIFDVYNRDVKLTVVKETAVKFNLGIDLKLSHLFKSKETKMYNYFASGFPEALPVRQGLFKTVFLYTFHGLTDYKKTLKEIRRVIRGDGVLLAIALNDVVKKKFICFGLYKYFKAIRLNRLSDFFLKLDAGRQREIGEIFSKNLKEWKALFLETGFEIEDIYTQVSPFLWGIYDVQTRPFLRILIHLTQKLKKWRSKLIIKFLWVCLWFPVLVIFYLFCARNRKIETNEEARDIFFTFRARPV